MARKADGLIVIGTSLKIHGLKSLIKSFADVVRSKKGPCIFMNLSAPSNEWNDVFDTVLLGPCDDSVAVLSQVMKGEKEAELEKKKQKEVKLIHIILFISNPGSLPRKKRRKKSADNLLLLQTSESSFKWPKRKHQLLLPQNQLQKSLIPNHWSKFILILLYLFLILPLMKLLFRKRQSRVQSRTKLFLKRRRVIPNLSQATPSSMLTLPQRHQSPQNQ